MVLGVLAGAGKYWLRKLEYWLGAVKVLSVGNWSIGWGNEVLSKTIQENKCYFILGIFIAFYSLSGHLILYK